VSAGAGLMTGDLEPLAVNLRLRFLNVS
jgi:hypothetical protein